MPPTFSQFPSERPQIFCSIARIGRCKNWTPEMFNFSRYSVELVFLQPLQGVHMTVLIVSLLSGLGFSSCMLMHLRWVKHTLSIIKRRMLLLFCLIFRWVNHWCRYTCVYFEDKDKSVYRNGIEKLGKRWNDCRSWRLLWWIKITWKFR